MMRTIGLVLGCAVAVFAAAPAMAAEHVLDNKGKAFTPKAIEAKVGDTLTVSNSDEFTHNVYEKSGPTGFNLDTIEPGQRKSVALDKPGTIEVRCAIHPLMKATVTVAP